MARTPQSEPFDCVSTSIIVTLSSEDGLLTKLAMRRTVSFEIGLYNLSYTWTAPVSQPTVDMVVSDMYDLYKLPRMDLECKHLQYRRLQSCHVGEKLKQEYLSCMNDLVSEETKQSPDQNVTDKRRRY